MNLTRALHPSDYDLPALRPYVLRVQHFESLLRRRGIPFRKDHEHRTWEYANVLYQIDHGLFSVPTRRELRVLDTGAGGSSLAPMLADEGYSVTVTDSMAYGDIIQPFLIPQCQTLGLYIPVVSEGVEVMTSVPDATFDVTLCISVIEHVAADLFEQALRELCRVTKPHGYLFLTSDYFRNIEQGEQSPYKQIQHTRFVAAVVERIPEIIPVEFIGGIDLTYRGDFVHNYSFINVCLRKLLVA